MNKRLKNILVTSSYIIGTLLVLYLITVIIFLKGTSPIRKNNNQVNEIAIDKTPITKIKTNYHLSTDTISDSVYGINKAGKKYYFVFVPKTNKGYLYPANKGKSKSQIINIFNEKHSNYKNVNYQFGWYKKLPVWEISYKKNNGNYGYAIYSFKTGKELFYGDNL